MSKYRLTIRGQKGDYKVELECDEIEFKNSWWAVFKRYAEPVGTIEMAAALQGQHRSYVVAAVPSEHLNLIEKVETT